MSGSTKLPWNPVAANAPLQLPQSNSRSGSESKFEEVRPEVLKAINRKVPRKEILKALKAHGLKMSPAKLAELLERAPKRFSESVSATPRGRRSNTDKASTQHSPILVANDGVAS